MLGAVRVVGEQDQLGAGGEDEHDADHRLLQLAHPALAPQEERGRRQRRRNRADLHRPAVRFPAHRVRGDHPEPRDLSDRQIDEHDAALQHELSQRHVRRQHQNPGEERGKQDRQLNVRHARHRPGR
jgi:hypothetical protein